MKLGILAVIVGAVIVLLFATTPIVQIFLLLPYGVSIDWVKLGICFAIALFLGGIPFAWGRERIKRARQKTKMSGE